MGSGSRFKFHFCPRWWALGLGFDDFPFERVVIVMIGPFQLEVGFGRAYDEREKQAEQEPVAWVDAKEEGYEFYGISYLPVGKHHLYAAPVRTKDLTDDEIEQVRKSFGDEVISAVALCRAVIAKFKEKNK